VVVVVNLAQVQRVAQASSSFLTLARNVDRVVL
jgi:hypothetical protein